MSKKIKKTGYQLMAREFACHYRYGENNEQKDELWGIDFFNQQADIPDAWNELKKLYKELHKEVCERVDKHDNMTIKNLYKTSELQLAETGRCAGMFYILHKIGKFLQQTGIEVE